MGGMLVDGRSVILEHKSRTRQFCPKSSQICELIHSADTATGNNNDTRTTNNLHIFLHSLKSNLLPLLQNTSLHITHPPSFQYGTIPSGIPHGHAIPSDSGILSFRRKLSRSYKIIAATPIPSNHPYGTSAFCHGNSKGLRAS